MIDFNKPIKLVSNHTWLIIICLPMVVAIFILASPPEGSIPVVPQINYEQTSTPVSEKFDVNDMNDKIDIHIQAQQFVLQTLKSPSTAKFPALPYEVIDLGDGFYKVSSYVDSQNSFGAVLRGDWSVRMVFVLDHWFLDRMIFDGKVVYDATSSNPL